MKARLDAARQLAILNAVSEAVGRSGDLREVMDLALGMVCDLLELRTGWVYLLEEGSGEPRLIAGRNLPPVFQVEPERWEGLCFCVESLLEGNAAGAANVNVISCSRLWQVTAENPEGLRFHASIPFYAAGRQMGIMNVARRDWRPLERAELDLLTTLGNQLGMAAERSRLVEVRTQQAVRDERDRLARELHDTLMQGLTGIALQLETAEELLGGQPTPARARLKRALSMTQETLAETRAAVENLGPIALREQPLWRALTALGEEFQRLYGIAVEVDAPPLAQRPPPPLEQGLYRVVQEGLNNVVKHAGASRVQVGLRAGEGRLRLVIEDDGRGFVRERAAAALHGYGLHSMRRRVRMLGGRFRLVTAPGRGTRVEASVPFDD